MESCGGCVAVDGDESLHLPLPIAGLMSNLSGREVAQRYSELTAFVRRMGSTLEAPFMTLSFLALLVIPELKLSDRGLFDGRSFEFVPLFQR
jgi:adenine deaminase